MWRGRGAVAVERLDGPEPPSLAFFPFSLVPDDGFPVWRQNKPRAGIRHLDAVAAGFVEIEKESLLDGMLVRTGLDVDAVLEANIGGAQHVLAAVHRIGDVMEAASYAGVIERNRKIVGLVGAGEPDCLLAGLEQDLLGHAHAELLHIEAPRARDIDGEEVEMIEPAHGNTARGISLRLVLERGLELRRRRIPLGLVVKLDHVAVGIAASIGRAVADIAVDPADMMRRILQRGDAPLKRLGAARSERGVHDAGSV